MNRTDPDSWSEAWKNLRLLFASIVLGWVQDLVPANSDCRGVRDAIDQTFAAIVSVR